MGDIKSLVQNLSGHEGIVKVMLAVALTTLLLGMAVGWMAAGRFAGPDLHEGAGVEISGLVSEELVGDGAEEAQKVCVEVSGAVMSPGVFCFDEGSRVVDALARAGEFNFEGYAYKYVSRRINLARPLIPDEKIYIPFSDDVSCETLSFAYLDKEIEEKNSQYLGVTEDTTGKDGQVGGDEEGDNGGDDEGGSQCININTATIDELISINGIGQTTAQNIINARPFTSLDELLDVNGIGQAKYELLLEFVCL